MKCVKTCFKEKNQTIFCKLIQKSRKFVNFSLIFQDFPFKPQKQEKLILKFLFKVHIRRKKNQTLNVNEVSFLFLF